MRGSPSRRFSAGRVGFEQQPTSTGDPLSNLRGPDGRNASRRSGWARAVDRASPRLQGPPEPAVGYHPPHPTDQSTKGGRTVAKSGPAFYDDDAVFAAYTRTREAWPDNPNDTLEQPILRAL